MRLVAPFVLLAALGSALSAPPAYADDDEDESPIRSETDAERATWFSSRMGLIGMQDMVDARIPELSLRGSVQYDARFTDHDIQTEIELSRQGQEHTLTFTAGASALGLVDVAIRGPFEYTRYDDQLKGVGDDPAGQTARGWGDVEVAGKIAIGFGPLVLSPYLWGRIPSGEPEVRDLARFEYGLAGTITLFNDYLAVHGNVVGLQESGGLSAFRYRLGASFVVYSEPDLLVRLYGYQDGVEFEGEPTSDLDLEVGAQALLFDLITVEVGGTLRLHHADRVDRATKRHLQRDLGLTERAVVEDAEVWGLRLAVGLAF